MITVIWVVMMRMTLMTIDHGDDVEDDEGFLVNYIWQLYERSAVANKNFQSVCLGTQQREGG